MSASTAVTGARKHLAGALGVVFILALWQRGAGPPDFPDAGRAGRADAPGRGPGQESFHQSLLGTLRLGAGYGLALAAGIGFGLVAAVLFFFREVLRSAIVILQSIPSIAWVPLFLIVMGFGSAHHRGGGVVGILSRPR